jgi:hypothetical protein
MECCLYWKGLWPFVSHQAGFDIPYLNYGLFGSSEGRIHGGRGIGLI